MIKYMIYILLGLVLLTAFFMFVEDEPISNSFTKEYAIQEVEFEALGETIFLKQVTWGVSSDSKITAISRSPEENIDYESEEDFIYKSGPSLFYKVKGDTLHILTGVLADKPALFNSDVIIYQEKIENREFNQLIKSHNEEGYLKFPK